MIRALSFNPGAGRFSPWLAALLGIVAIKAILCVSVASVPFVYSYSGISYLFLLILATGFSIRNAIRSSQRARPFWALLAAGCGLWAFHQFLDLYYQLVLHLEVPDDSIADDVLFLHLVPFMAAAASLPNLPRHQGEQHRWILNTILIFGLWGFLYGFIVAPYQYFPLGSGDYGSRFDKLYLVENSALILTLGVVVFRAKPPWKMIYLHLLGASTLYALSSTVANIATDSAGYLNGKLYGLGLTASVCWFVWIPLSARLAPETEIDTRPFADKRDSRVSGWAMLLVLMISIPMVWELSHRNENPKILTLRLIVATAAIVLLAGGAYLKEHLDKREQALERNRAEAALRLSEERFRLAAQAGRMYALEWDAATDAVVRSGDLQAVLGLKDEDLGPTLQEFLMKVHPDDRALVAASLRERVPERPSNQISYRFLRPDGSIVWLERTDHGFFDAQGNIARAVGMVANITERRHAEDALRESEEKFRSLFRDAGIGMVIVSPDGRFLAANSAFCETLGYTEEEILSLTVESVTFHEDWPAFSHKLGEALREGNGFRRQEKRCLHKSGRIVYTESTASLIRNSEGVPQFFVGEVVDVTARRESEEVLTNFNRRLIQAQEEERTRIARELHDDISQRMAVLAVRMEELKASPGGLSDDARNKCSKIQREASDLLMSISQLSHGLHSPTLELLGLGPAIRRWCAEFGENRSVEILFESHDVPTGLPAEASINLYRVLQEALNNAAKHSGVKRFDVRLWGTAAEINLSVTDHGKGFDPGSAMRKQGLGLKSMRERVKLISGNLAIESKPDCGTTIHARVPIHSAGKASQDIG